MELCAQRPLHPDLGLHFYQFPAHAGCLFDRARSVLLFRVSISKQSTRYDGGLLELLSSDARVEVICSLAGPWMTPSPKASGA